MFENDQNELNFMSKSSDSGILVLLDILNRDTANDQDIMPIEKPIKDNPPTSYSITG
jgi:hypothetical protein